MKSRNASNLQANAYFWDGTKQLPGILEVNKTELIFRFDDFRHSHLKLCIYLKDIEAAKVFLLFDVVKNGLKVSSKDNKVDLFILDEADLFCETLKRQMEKLS